MSIQDIVDAETGDIKVNVSDAMRQAALAMAQKYDALVKSDEFIRMPSLAVAEHSALISLERSDEYKALKAATYEANDHLNPKTMGGWTQREDMRAAHGGILNDLIAQEAAKAGVENVPVLFNKTARLVG